MLMKWMKRGLVSGLLLTSVFLVVGCSQQQAPAPAPEAPQMETPAAPSSDTTMAPTEDTTTTPAAEDTTKSM